MSFVAVVVKYYLTRLLADVHTPSAQHLSNAAPDEMIFTEIGRPLPTVSLTKKFRLFVTRDAVTRDGSSGGYSQAEDLAEFPGMIVEMEINILGHGF